ncbi:MAG: filamentous hemagglutinin N-terminal domain-containing protein [Phycisphaerales bacterium]|nr:filamentous hemagglutinin N-terminal domain-containing protein [Phycisphaerales bacterium]
MKPLLHLAATIAASAAALLGRPASGQSLPSGADTDCADVTVDGHTMTITQLTPGCIIDWAAFGIGGGYAVEFIQGDAWRVLNRVSGADASEIAGVLNASGTVYLVNPAGVVFTGSAVVNVGGLYAAAASLTDDDFAAGIDRFTNPTDKVVNQGSITASAVHLIGDRIANFGEISAGDGVVTLLAGENEVFIGEADGRVLVRIDGVELRDDTSVATGPAVPTTAGLAGVENSGTIDAAGGEVILGVGDMYALAIRSAGTINAAGGSTQLAALGGTVHHRGALQTGTLNVTGEAIFLESDIHADTARFNDPVIIGADVRIDGEDGDAADSVHFASTVDDADDATHRLEIDATQSTFDGDVGGERRLHTLETTGGATIAGDVDTAAGIVVGGSALLTGSETQTLDAGAGHLQIGGNASKVTGGDLVLRASDTVAVGGTVSVTFGSVTVDGDAVIGGDVTAGTDVMVTGAADIDGDALAGRDVIIDGDATLAGDVLAGRDLTLGGDTTLDGSSAQAMRASTGRIDASGDIRKIGGGTLLVQAADAIDVGGDVTVATTSGSGNLSLAAPVMAIGGDVSATGTVLTSGALDVGGNLSAGVDARLNGDTIVGGSVTTGDDALFLGAANVGGDVTATGDVTFAGLTAVIGSVDAGSDASFSGTTTVAGDVSAGRDVEFAADATIGGSVHAGDDAIFFGAADVGGNVTAIADAEFSGAAVIGGDVTTGEDLDFLGAADIGGNVAAGEDVIFSSAADVGGDVAAGDDATFFGAASIGGSLNTIGDIEFHRVAEVGGSVSAGEDVDFFDDAVVGGDIVTGDDVLFAAGADIGGSITAFDDVEFFDDATVGGSITAGDDIQFFGEAEVDGDLVAGDDVEFAQRALLGGSITAYDDVKFDGPAVFLGTGTQRIEAVTGVLRARGVIRKTTAGTLELFGPRLILNGGEVTALDDVLLNPAGRVVPSPVATITAQSNLIIRSELGHVRMGAGEKLAVQGDLTIEAGGTATLGDVSTRGDMTVLAQEIVLLRRAAASVLDAGGSLVPDDGVDYVAGGRFFFSVIPSLGGGGPTPVFGSRRVDADALGTLGAFRLRIIVPFGNDLFRSGDTLLDLRATGPTVSDLAVAYSAGAGDPAAGRRVRTAATDAASAQASLQPLGVAVRALDPAAPISIVDDLPASAEWATASPSLSVLRLDADAVTAVVDAYTALLGTPAEAASARAALDAAWAAYQRTEPSPDGPGFRRFVTNPAHADAAATLDRLATLSRAMLVMGANQTEMISARRRLLRVLRPEAIRRRDLETAIDAR